MKRKNSQPMARLAARKKSVQLAASMLLLSSCSPAPDARGPRPSCLHGELCQRDPSGRLARVHPDTIQAPIVFYDTCAGFLAHGGIASLEASLGTGFIEGPAGAFVTSVRKKMSDPFAALLFRALLKDGVALGTIARHLNTYQRSEYGELPSFFVIGDPAFRSPGASVDEDTRVDDIAAWRSHAVSCKPMTSSRDDLVVAQGIEAAIDELEGNDDLWIGVLASTGDVF